MFLLGEGEADLADLRLRPTDGEVESFRTLFGEYFGDDDFCVLASFFGLFLDEEEASLFLDGDEEEDTFLLGEDVALRFGDNGVQLRYDGEVVTDLWEGEEAEELVREDALDLDGEE